MDLYAYSQIDELDELVKKNGISVPRLRGYRLMKDEQPIDYTDVRRDIELDVVENLCRSEWGRSPWTCYSIRTDKKAERYIKNLDCRYMDKDDPEYKAPEICWDRIKGKKRRIVKTRIKNELRGFKKQYEVWNKYCGREDILYIHARIGGGNWSSYCDQVVDQPWFLEKVDDGWDGTYCDIYAKIEVGAGK